MSWKKAFAAALAFSTALQPALAAGIKAPRPAVKLSLPAPIDSSAGRSVGPPPAAEFSLPGEDVRAAASASPAQDQNLSPEQAKAVGDRWFAESRPGAGSFDAVLVGMARFGAATSRLPAPGPGLGNPWPLMEERLRFVLRPETAQSRTTAWRESALERLRNNPEEPLARAMGLAFAEVHGLAPGQAKAAVRFLEGKPVLDLSQEGVLRFFPVAGRLYAWGRPNKLKLYQNGSWQEERLKDVGSLNALRELDGVLYAATDRGLYRKEADGAWAMILKGYLYDAAWFEKDLYAATETGLLRLGRRGWERQTLKGKRPDPTVYHLREIAGEPHAFTDQGVYRIGEAARNPIQALLGRLTGKTGRRDWISADTPIAQHRYGRGSVMGVHKEPVAVYHALESQGKVYLASNAGVWVKESGSWSLVADFPAMWLREINGLVFARSWDGFVSVDGRAKKEHREIGDMAEFRGLQVSVAKEGLKWQLSGPRFLEDMLTDAGPPPPPAAPLASGRRALFGAAARRFGGNRSQIAALKQPSEPESPETWLVLGRWLEGKLGLSQDTRVWRRKAAELLRNDPGISLTAALAQAFVDGREVNEKKLAEAKDFLSRDEILVQVLQSAPVSRIIEAEGRLFAATADGLYVLDAGAWRLEKKFSGRVWLGLTSQGVVVMTRRGAFKYQGGAWVRLAPLRFWTIIDPLAVGYLGWADVMEAEGRLYLRGYDKRLYVMGRWAWRQELRRAGEVSQIFKLGETLHALNDLGELYRLNGGVWSKRGGQPGKVDRVGIVAGQAYAHIPGESYYRLSDAPSGGFFPVPLIENKYIEVEALGSTYRVDMTWGGEKGMTLMLPRLFTAYFAQLNSFVEHEGRLYGIGKSSDRLIEISGSEHRMVDPDPEKIRVIAKTSLGLYAGAEQGIWKLLSRKAWEHALLKDLGREIGSQRASPSDARAPRRLLFSGSPAAVRRAENASGGLGAALRELARWLGLSRSRLPAPDGPPSENDPWPALEAKLLRFAGSSPQSRVADWKESTAAILSSNPEMRLAQAMALGLAEAYALRQGQAAAAESALLGAALPGTRGKSIERVFRVGNEIYAASNFGLWRFDAGVWRDENPRLGRIRHLTKLAKKVYAATETGVYRQGKGGWEPVFSGGAANMTGAWDGRLYVAADTGFWGQDADGLVTELIFPARTWRARLARLFIPWKDHSLGANHFLVDDDVLYLSAADRLYQAETVKGLLRWRRIFHENVLRRSSYLFPTKVSQSAWIGSELHAATNKGLMARGDRGWRKVIHEPVLQILRHDGKDYAATAHALYAKGPGGWAPALRLVDPRGQIHGAASDGAALYLGTEQGVRALMMLESGWENSFIKGLAEILERRKPASMLNQDKDGRVIFDNSKKKK